MLHLLLNLEFCFPTFRKHIQFLSDYMSLYLYTLITSVHFKYLWVLFTSNEKMKREIKVGGLSRVCVDLGGEEGAEPQCEALDLPVLSMF